MQLEGNFVGHDANSRRTTRREDSEEKTKARKDGPVRSDCRSSVLPSMTEHDSEGSNPCRQGQGKAEDEIDLRFHIAFVKCPKTCQVKLDNSSSMKLVPGVPEWQNARQERDASVFASYSKKGRSESSTMCAEN